MSQCDGCQKDTSSIGGTWHIGVKGYCGYCLLEENKRLKERAEKAEQEREGHVALPGQGELPAQDEMSRSEWFARKAWCYLSLGNIARPANFEETIKHLEPFFAQAIAEARAEAIEECAHHVASRAEAYPVDIFPEIRRGDDAMRDQVSAAMARHCASLWAEQILSLLDEASE